MENTDECRCDQPDPWVDDLDRRLCFNCLCFLGTFQYRRFKTETEIRLISLFPGKGEDQLFCEIVNANLDDQPVYEAVSYTWGDPSRPACVFCLDSKFLDITRNCAAALRNLRYNDKMRTLWIDAICINQDDKNERAHQVKLMQRVYSQAQKVLIHLAPSVPEDVASAINFISKDLLPTMDEYEVSEAQRGLTSLVSLPWFSRVWVLQEVASAREAFIIIGDIKRKWSFLSHGRLASAGLTLENNSRSIPPVLQLADGNKKPFKTLSSLITAARRCLSSDPRDKIFGLLGLLKKQSGFRILPDYRESVGDLYTKVTNQTIRTVNNLDILSEVGREAEEASDTRRNLHNHVEALKKKAEELEIQRKHVEKTYKSSIRRLHRLDFEEMPPSESFIEGLSFDLFSQKLLRFAMSCEFSSSHMKFSACFQFSESLHKRDRGALLDSTKRCLEQLLGELPLFAHHYQEKQSEPDEPMSSLLQWKVEEPRRSREHEMGRGVDPELWTSLTETDGLIKSQLRELCQETSKNGDQLHAWIQGNSGTMFNPIHDGNQSGYETETEGGCRSQQTHSLARVTFETRDQSCTKRRRQTSFTSSKAAENTSVTMGEHAESTGLDDAPKGVMEIWEDWKLDGAKDKNMATFFDFLPYQNPNEVMATIVGICTLLAGIGPKIQNLGRLEQELPILRDSVEEAEGTIQSPPQRFANLRNGFLISYDWLGGQLLSSTTDDPHEERIRLPSWVPDFSKPARCSSLNVWRSDASSESAIAPEDNQENFSTPVRTLRVSILELQRFSPQWLAKGVPYAFPDVLGKCDYDRYPVILLHSPDQFWSDMARSLQGQSHSIKSVRNFSYGRKLGKTEKSFAICPLGTESTDIICLISGSCVPFVLRRTDPLENKTSSSLPENYKLIGECYLHGFRGPTVMKEDQNYVELLGAFAGESKADDLQWKQACLL